MSRIFIDGFESGGVDLWDACTGAVMSAAGKDMDGTYCLEFDQGEEIIVNIPASDTYYLALKFRDSYSSGSNQHIRFRSGATELVRIVLDVHTFEVFRGWSDSLGVGSAVIAQDTTYLIEIKVVIHDTTGEVVIKVDGVTDVNLTNQDTKPGADTTIDNLKIVSTSPSMSTYYDNVILDDAAWIGETKIQAITPSAGGNSGNWAASAGSNFQCVDEIPASDVDYVSVNANNIVDTYVMTDMTGSPDTVKCVQIQSRTESDGSPTPTNLQLVARPSSVDRVSSSKAVPAAPKSLFHIWETNPDDSLAWEVSDVNGMEAGIKSIA